MNNQVKNIDVKVTLADRSNLEPLGLVYCLIDYGPQKLGHSFIV